MLLPSVITVDEVILLKGEPEHVTPWPHAANGFLSSSEKSQNLYQNLQVPPSLGLSLLLFLVTFPLPHSALATLTSALVPKRAGLLLPQGLCTWCPACSAPHCISTELSSLVLLRSAGLSPSQGGPP